MSRCTTPKDGDHGFVDQRINRHFFATQMGSAQEEKHLLDCGMHLTSSNNDQTLEPRDYVSTSFEGKDIDLKLDFFDGPLVHE